MPATRTRKQAGMRSGCRENLEVSVCTDRLSGNLNILSLVCNLTGTKRKEEGGEKKGTMNKMTWIRLP